VKVDEQRRSLVQHNERMVWRALLGRERQANKKNMPSGQVDTARGKPRQEKKEEKKIGGERDKVKRRRHTNGRGVYGVLVRVTTCVLSFCARWDRKPFLIFYCKTRQKTS
jgi:hypothetical protein